MKQVFILLLFLLFNFIFSQEVDSLALNNGTTNDTVLISKKNSIGRQLVVDGKQIFNNIGHSYLSPLSWKKDNWLDVGGVALGTVLLYTVDNNTSQYFIDQSPKVPKVIKKFGYYFGSPQNNYGITSVVYLTGLFTKNDKIRDTGVLMISSATTAGLIQTLSKTLVGRARPGTGVGKSYFKPFSGEAEYRSFPSGHTVLVSTTMFALAKQFSNPWVKAGIYGVGFITPLSRMWEGAHFFSDIFLSTAISYFIVDGTYRYMQRNHEKKEQKFSWKLSMSPNMLGLHGTF
ncbi:phosphoesterase [Chryseobacterium sp. T16E-39]|uniref:phosphatase PAP2 family protein n=1 Tax=Chryseobacterium sp. T16E-39 TaxID=2015076 RepID=UPI000B5B4567|nr:phosphatase PAP2 family protein [Chryseobacterium sp. T16E-39]ASK30047.1 phosphoesterase [Chryseobacterium sp. T16E-39]